MEKNRRIPHRLRPRIAPVEASRYVVAEDYVHNIYDTDRRRRVVIPAGCEFDGASIPRALWVAIRPLRGDLIAAALVHDWLYAGEPWQVRRGEAWTEAHPTREEADVLMLAIMWESGLSSWRVQAVYRAVRAFGGMYWRGKT